MPRCLPDRPYHAPALDQFGPMIHHETDREDQLAGKRTNLDEGLAEIPFRHQLMEIARDPMLRGSVYAHFAEYCHTCRNRLNSLKLGLYLMAKQSPCGSDDAWSEVDRRYLELEQVVDRVQTLFRPWILSPMTLGIDLLIADRREDWSRRIVAQGCNLQFDAPKDRAIASFDVERMGLALDTLVRWRAAILGKGQVAVLGWYSRVGRAHLVWHESGPSQPGGSSQSNDWALAIVARVAAAHGGQIGVTHDPGWRLELSWPSPSVPSGSNGTA
jgi:hypothetical protein